MPVSVYKCVCAFAEGAENEIFCVSAVQGSESWFRWVIDESSSLSKATSIPRTTYLRCSSGYACVSFFLNLYRIQDVEKSSKKPLA